MNAENLRAWRLRRGLTLAQLAELTGLGIMTISRYENGEGEPRKTTTRLLELALRTGIGGLDSMPPTER